MGFQCHNTFAFLQIPEAYNLIEPWNLLLYFEVPVRDSLKELFNYHMKIIWTKQARNAVKFDHPNEPIKIYIQENQKGTGKYEQQLNAFLSWPDAV